MKKGDPTRQFPNPPQYPNLPAPGISSNSADDNSNDTRTLVSFESNLTLSSPPYVSSHDLFGPSVATLTNRPRYSSAFDGDLSPAHNLGRRVSSNHREFAFDVVRGGFKSQLKWATLHLKNARSHGSKGKYPRISGTAGRILGKVEIPLPSPQPITAIKLVFKGTLQRPNHNVEAREGAVKILNQTYTLWDRKNGDSNPPAEIPFTIPFPTHVKLSTLSAADNAHSEVNLSSSLQIISSDAEHRDVTTLTIDDDCPPEKEEPQHEESCRQDPNTHITPFDVDIISTSLTKARIGSENAMAENRSSSPTLEETSRSSSPKRRSRWSLLSVPFSKKCGPCDDDIHSPSSSTLGSVAAGFGDCGNKTATATPGGSSSKSSIEAAEELPPSFFERGVPVSIRYELTLLITHGRFSSDSKVKTPLIYTPKISRSLPMPFTRQLAYRALKMPLGPHRDPDAWKKLSSVRMHGTFLDNRELTVEYTLYLANPLSYARGTVIPCYMTVACGDENLLSLLTNPQTPKVSLYRLMYTPGLKEGSGMGVHSTAYNPHASHSTAMPGEVRLSAFDLVTMQGSGKKRPSSAGASEGLSHIEGRVETRSGLPEGEAEQTLCSDAFWWADHASEELAQERPRGIKALHGEIRLSRGLYPTCAFPLFMIWYRVDLLAPALSAFVPDVRAPGTHDNLKGKGAMKGQDSHDGGAYVSQVVEITTDVRDDEPFPITFSRNHIAHLPSL